MRGTLLIILIIVVGCKSVHDEDLMVLVSVGELDSTMEKLPRSIMVLDSLQPKVIGIDLDLSKHTTENSKALLAALNACKSRFVLRNDIRYFKEPIDENSGFVDDDSSEFDSFSSSISYSNLIEEVDVFGTVKKYSSWEKINKRKTYQFGIKVAFMYDSIKTNEFLNRNPKINNIDFHAGKMFNVVTLEDIVSGKVEREGIEGKIVLIGLLGTGFTDRYYSGAIKRGNGSFVPDMFNCEFQAHIALQALGK